MQLQQQLLGRLLPSQLLGRAATGQAADDAELQQYGVKAAPAQAAVNESQKQQQSKKKGKNGFINCDYCARPVCSYSADLKHVVGWLCSCAQADLTHISGHDAPSAFPAVNATSQAQIICFIQIVCAWVDGFTARAADRPMSVDMICGIQCNSTANVSSNDDDSYHMFIGHRCRARALKQASSAHARPSTNLYALIQERSPFAVSGRDNVDVLGQTGPAKQHQQHMKKKGRLALTLQDQSWAVQPVGSCWLQRFPSRRFRS